MWQLGFLTLTADACFEQNWYMPRSHATIKQCWSSALPKGSARWCENRYPLVFFQAARRMKDTSTLLSITKLSLLSTSEVRHRWVVCALCSMHEDSVSLNFLVCLKWNGYAGCFVWCQRNRTAVRTLIQGNYYGLPCQIFEQTTKDPVLGGHRSRIRLQGIAILCVHSQGLCNSRDQAPLFPN